MYYDIFINESFLATVGLDKPQHLSISISLSKHDEVPLIMANGMAQSECGKQVYLTWLSEHVTSSDTFRISLSKNNKVSEPIQTREINLGKASKENKFCDFCKDSESAVGKIVQTGDTPFICKNCTELAIEIIKGR